MQTTAYVVKAKLSGSDQDLFLVMGPPVTLNDQKANATQFTDKNSATVTAAELLASNLGTMESTEVVDR